MARVFNMRDAEERRKAGPNAQYVGRPTKYGNPFVIGRDGNRAEVIEKYEDWLLETFDPNEVMWDLRGRNLLCWCAPEACHADVLLRVAN